jgi:O-antigen/teichoic acid export membrane protein
MKQLSIVVDNIVALLLRQVLTWTLTAILMVFFLPRYLGDEGLGKIVFAVALTTMLLVLTNMGTATFTVKQLALDRSRVSELLWNAYGIRLLSGLLIAGALVSVVHFLALEPDAKAVLYIASATMIVMGLDKAQVAAIQGLENMRWIAAAEVANKATVMVLGIAVLVAGHGVVTYALVLLVGASVSFLVNGSYLGLRYLRWPRFSVGTAMLLIVGGFPFFVTGALGQVYMWADIVVVRLMTRDEVVGWLGAAVQLYTTMNVVPLVIVTAMLPALTRFHAEDRETMRVAAQRSVQAVLITGVPLAMALMLLSGDVIHFLRYPGEFGHSVPLLALLAVNMPVTGTLMIVGTIVIAANRQRQWAIAMLLTTVLSLILDPGLVLVFDRFYGNGAIGAVVTTVIAEGFMISIGLRLMPEGLLDRGMFSILFRALGASLAMVGAMGAAKAVLEPGLVPLALIGAPVYCVALLAAGGVTAGDIKALAGSILRREPAAEPPLAGTAATGYATAQVGSEGL